MAVFCITKTACAGICNTSQSVKNLRLVPVATLMKLKIPKSYDDVEYPERKRLQMLPRQPIVGPEVKIRPMRKATELIRGEELVHNKIQYGRFAIQALEGGYFLYGHMEMLRLTINRNFDESCMFLKWRIDPPWRPVTKKTQGSRMGMGKGAIKYFATPVKAHRIILELGGEVEFKQAKIILSDPAMKCPVRARVVSKEKLEQEEQMEKEMEEKNINPFSWVRCAKHNYLGIRSNLSPYDIRFKGKYK